MLGGDVWVGAGCVGWEFSQDRFSVVGFSWLVGARRASLASSEVAKWSGGFLLLGSLVLVFPFSGCLFSMRFGRGSGGSARDWNTLFTRPVCFPLFLAGVDGSKGFPLLFFCPFGLWGISPL